MFVALQAMPAACAAGDIEAASRYVDDVVAYAQVVGTDQTWAGAYGSQADLFAWMGRIHDARTAGEKALALYRGAAAASYIPVTLGVLGMAELAVGDHEAAAGRLTAATNLVTSMGLARLDRSPTPS